LPCVCGNQQRYRGVRPRNLLTIVGGIVVPRRYFACSCGCGASPMDAWAGIGRRTVSEHARRVIVLAGSTWSFDQAASKLAELCQLKTSNDTVRAICDEEGQRAGQWIRQNEASAQKLTRASGELEFSTDGTSVNTTEGWREMRLSVLSKRVSGEGAGPQQWDDRQLPRPTARLAWSQIADCRRIGARWQRMFDHAGVEKDAALSVIADGARWIWDQAHQRLPGVNTQWVVDVYHVSQHIHACGKSLFGEADPRAKAWSNAELQCLIELGGPKFIERLDDFIRDPVSPAPGTVAAMKQLRTYLWENRDRMWYRQRLAAGRPIGSGLIEGGCKNAIGARLKLNAARWRVQRAERMGNLRCLALSQS
jgi:hypothetical protein